MSEIAVADWQTLELGGSEFYPQIRMPEEMEVTRLSSAAIQFAEFLWQAIGADHWPGRDWSNSDWFERLSDIEVGFFAVSCGGEPAGLFEISKNEAIVRIDALGLMASYRGYGLGHGLVTAAIEKGFAMDAKYIQVAVPSVTDQRIVSLLCGHGFRRTTAATSV